MNLRDRDFSRFRNFRHFLDFSGRDFEIPNLLGFFGSGFAKIFQDFPGRDFFRNFLGQDCLGFPRFLLEFSGLFGIFRDFQDFPARIFVISSDFPGLFGSGFFFDFVGFLGFSGIFLDFWIFQDFLDFWNCLGYF